MTEAAVLEGFRCSTAARERGESMVGTAPAAARWLLLEMPGAWPANIVDHPELSSVEGRQLVAEATERETRIGFIRAPRQRSRTALETRRCAFVDAVPGPVSVRWATWTSPKELIDGAFERLDAAAGVEPFALVCTHAKHDVCCAVRGRPVLDAFMADGRLPVWECSHLGGDRFAANVLLGPSGAVYGRVEPSDVPELVDAALAQSVVPRLLRGMSGWPRVVQAAQHAAREAGYGDGAVDALPALAVDSPETGLWRVVLGLSGPGGAGPRVTVGLRERRIDLITASSCGGEQGASAVVHDLTGLEYAPVHTDDGSAGGSEEDPGT